MLLYFCTAARFAPPLLPYKSSFANRFARRTANASSPPSQWRDLLKTAGFDATLYNIEGDRLLVSIQKGWHGDDIRNFFLTRPEVGMVTWNGVETNSLDYVEL